MTLHYRDRLVILKLPSNPTGAENLVTAPTPSPAQEKTITTILELNPSSWQHKCHELASVLLEDSNFLKASKEAFGNEYIFASVSNELKE